MAEQDASAAPQWELKKENVAPVKKGVRDVGALNAALRAREGLRSLPGKEEEARKEERRYVEGGRGTESARNARGMQCMGVDGRV